LGYDRDVVDRHSPNEREEEPVRDVYAYQIEVEGQLDESDVNAMSPLQVTVRRRDEVATLLTARTDQAGLIGLLRHLHGRGNVLLSVAREG
jgi:hypothetical protein